MRVSNGVYKPLKIDWANITFPLKEGSPVSLAGVVANNGNAIGLVPHIYTEEPLMKSIYVLVGGDVDLAEIEEAFGTSLATAAKANMNGLRFWKADGTVDDSADNSLPSVTAEDNGDVLTVVDGAWAKATPSGGGTWVLLYGTGKNTEVVEPTAPIYIDISEFWGDEDGPYTITSADIGIISAFDGCGYNPRVELVMPYEDDPLMVSWNGFNTLGEPLGIGDCAPYVQIAVLNPVLVEIEEND